MRGKGSGTLPHYDHQGITPACAGKSLKLSSRTTGRRDHPRVCGEKVNLEAGVCRVWGSPPRMRGKVDLQVIACIFLGITPAYAGKRSIWRPGSAGCGDHPRVCGEKHPSTAIRQRNTGSPPRVRGKVRVQAPVQEHRGITPDCAGKSGRESGTRACCRDHPRVCGEKDKAAEKAQHLRGKAVHHKHRHSPGRITPAHAGKRTRPRRWVRPPRDHPRACGEKITDETIGVVIQGSPPRVRGKARGASLLCQHLRITPAYAGKI